MSLTRLANNVLIDENFLTKDQCSSIIDAIEEQAKNEKLLWTPISFYESYSSILPKDNDQELEQFNLSPTIFSEIKQGIINAVAEIDSIDPESICQIGYHTQKWEPGAYARIHSDNTDEEGNPSAFERSRYAGFVYLNDDFEGGILNFPKSDISIKPKNGMLAVFAGGFEIMHEVTLITKGVRYTLGSFWDDREESEYPEELKEKWKSELKIVRDSQEKEKAEWQELIKKGYKIDETGKKYKITKEQD